MTTNMEDKDSLEQFYGDMDHKSKVYNEHETETVQQMKVRKLVAIKPYYTIHVLHVLHGN